jgi:hypothetical protein
MNKVKEALGWIAVLSWIAAVGYWAYILFC